MKKSWVFLLVFLFSPKDIFFPLLYGLRGEKHQLPPIYRGWNLQSGYVPRPGNELAIFWSMGRRSNQLSYTGQGKTSFKNNFKL